MEACTATLLLARQAGRIVAGLSRGHGLLGGVESASGQATKGSEQQQEEEVEGQKERIVVAREWEDEAWRGRMGSELMLPYTKLVGVRRWPWLGWGAGPGDEGRSLAACKRTELAGLSVAALVIPYTCCSVCVCVQ